MLTVEPGASACGFYLLPALSISRQAVATSHTAPNTADAWRHLIAEPTSGNPYIDALLPLLALLSVL